jgi:uncharacterized membrane protein YvbJ|tara:strand:+ start:562 stop:795 length:234 start_codon:yes stop_codon:yes gene_type:complete
VQVRKRKTCPKCGKRNTYWNGDSNECHDCGTDYEATTADEFNEEYLQEAADDMQEQTDIHYAKKSVKGSRDGYWESK